MTDPTHDEIRELLGAFALDAVAPDEARLVEAHLRECGACAEEVAGHREVAAALAHSYDAPPDGLWSRIRDEIDAHSDQEATVLPIELRRAITGAQTPTARPEASSGRWLVAVAAAVLVVALLGGLVVQQRSRIDDLEDTASPSMVDLADDAASRPGARTVELTGPGASVDVVVDPTGTVYLHGDTLPVLGSDRTYQLWSVSGDHVVSLGVLGSEPGVSTFVLPSGTEALAVTDEVAGGVVQSDREPVVVGAVVE